MRYGVILTGVGPMADPERLIRAARKADQLGFESLWLYEHVAFPTRVSDAYGKLPFTPETAFLEPITTLSYLAAETRQIRLGTGILLLALRHPLHVAKAVATLDVLSKGRVILGVGLGWLAEEFAAFAVPFHERAGLVRESVEVLRKIWADGKLEFNGRYFSFSEVTSHPMPIQRGGPPIWFGGTVDRALRRAAELGDGWLGRSGRPDNVERWVRTVRQRANELGKNHFAIAVSAGPEITREEAAQFERIGADQINLVFASGEAEEIERKLEAAAKQLVD
jgi:probable F420-dependent oxidoreductase